jgi:hypothetical protein
MVDITTKTIFRYIYFVVVHPKHKKATSEACSVFFNATAEDIQTWRKEQK